MAVMKERAKQAIRRTLPLSARKSLSLLLWKQGWLAPNTRSWWIRELLRDFERADSGAYHRFLWANHLAYAETYDAARRFGAQNVKESRRLFFADLERVLRAKGIDPRTGVRSVFEVGCSLGYQLQHLEDALFGPAADLAGIDIDRCAIEEGAEHLRRCGSRVRIVCADMGELHAALGGEPRDVILSTGVLMYLAEPEAATVVRDMVRHTRQVLALSGPACPDRDNRELDRSRVRERDGAFVHNLDAMVEAAGARVVGRRWDGPRLVDGHTIYFVFAAPATGGDVPGP